MSFLRRSVAHGRDQAGTSSSAITMRGGLTSMIVLHGHRTRRRKEMDLVTVVILSFVGNIRTTSGAVKAVIPLPDFINLM